MKLYIGLEAVCAAQATVLHTHIDICIKDENEESKAFLAYELEKRDLQVCVCVREYNIYRGGGGGIGKRG